MPQHPAYDRDAEALGAQYEALKAADVHGSWARDHLPQDAGLACDIGAGTGRDARWLAELGWEVVAVEPSAALRGQGADSDAPGVTWLSDSLPELQRLRTIGHRFDFMLLSAVWQHIPEAQRRRAFRILADRLKPGGTLVITLRHGSDAQENAERGFHPVSAAELQALARERALVVKAVVPGEDLSRPHVHWETVVLTLPDDGTGSLPLLRHIIVNDNKSASYKLALLRTLTRIAEGAPGAARLIGDDEVAIPLGLVGLYWLRQYLALLLRYGIREQANAKTGYGFKKAAFDALGDLSPFDLRVGSTLSPEFGRLLTRALNDACTTIAKMPAHYITWPGTNQQIFEAERTSVRASNGALRLSLPFLEGFGTLRIPGALWQTLGQYACWLEPTILNEWAALQRQWNPGHPMAGQQNVFAWEDSARDTSLPTQRARALLAAAYPLRCAWSHKQLREGRPFEIDHAFPWSRWANNDLWNLLPTDPVVNQKKSDKLPSAAALKGSEEVIKEWWTNAWLGTEQQERFLMEATSALPALPEQPSADEIFEAMRLQRSRLKADQSLAEWALSRSPMRHN